MAKAVLAPASTKDRKCKGCGCTDDRACVGDLGFTCYWVMKDWCSSCDAKMLGPRGDT